MSNNEELVEVCHTSGAIEAEIVKLLLGSNGISCVFKYGLDTRIMVEKSKAEEAKRLIERKGKGAMFE